MTVHPQSTQLLGSSLAKKNIYSRMTDQHFVQWKYGQDILVFVAADKSGDQMESILHLISENKIGRSIVILDEADMSKLERKLENINQTTDFYVLKTPNLVWFKVITLKNVGKTIINGPIIGGKDIYNLQGLNIQGLTLSWPPYFSIEDCDSNGKHCMNQNGFLADVWDIFGSLFNFTWSSDKEPNGDWGMSPKNGGPYNLSSQWGGVMGSLVMEKVNMALLSRNYFCTLLRDDCNLSIGSPLYVSMDSDSGKTTNDGF